MCIFKLLVNGDGCRHFNEITQGFKRTATPRVKRVTAPRSQLIWSKGETAPRKAEITHSWLLECYIRKQVVHYKRQNLPACSLLKKDQVKGLQFEIRIV